MVCTETDRAWHAVVWKMSTLAVYESKSEVMVVSERRSAVFDSCRPNHLAPVTARPRCFPANALQICGVAKVFSRASANATRPCSLPRPLVMLLWASITRRWEMLPKALVLVAQAGFGPG